MALPFRSLRYENIRTKLVIWVPQAKLISADLSDFFVIAIVNSSVAADL